jgi:hypothetical protein
MRARVDENKDIIEIGNILNKSPGSIALILEKMLLVERNPKVSLS